MLEVEQEPIIALPPSQFSSDVLRNQETPPSQEQEEEEKFDHPSDPRTNQRAKVAKRAVSETDA